MFSFRKQEEKPSALDPLINDLVEQMRGIDEASEEYTKMLRNLRELYEAKALEPKRTKLDPNTVAVVAANLAGIVMILIFEKTDHIITSKSLGFILKPKI